MCVIQFNATMSMARAKLEELGYSNIEIPQEKPRCKGETLGCTSAVLEKSSEKDTVVFIADGRFHMEGAMIANPSLIFYKYNPYEKVNSLFCYLESEIIRY
jgi:2-(3-amino-3-carboxypropyl)histidine synthase